MGDRQSVDEEKLRLTTLTAVNKWKKEAKTRVREKKVRAKTLKAFSMVGLCNCLAIRDTSAP